MSYLRIRCRVPPPMPPIAGYPMINRVADLSDTDVCAIADDGTETPLPNVERVVFTVGGNEPARAVVTFFDVEIEADALASDTATEYEAP